jgi:hypothetical protein
VLPQQQHQQAQVSVQVQVQRVLQHLAQQVWL